MTISLVTKGMITSFKTSSSFTSGEIQIEANRWQMITVPVKFGYFDTIEGILKSSETVRSTIYNYVVQQLETVYSDDIENLITVINAYVGDNDFFYNYVPGFTSEGSIHNFNLVYEDGTMNEIVPFWIKSKVTFDMTLLWKF